LSYIGNQPYQVAFVTDTFSGNGSTTVFTMSVAPANTSSVLVAITGVLQDPSTYSVSGTTLTFSAAPPSGTSNISVRYLGIPASGVTTTAYRTLTEFTATAGQTTFTPPSYTAGFINVFRNGALLGTADYTATNGTTVVLASAAAAGDLVAIESFYVSSVLNAIPATAGAVNSTYITDSAVTTAKIADANVTQAKLGTGVAGTGPAFSAYGTTTQSCTNGASTKLILNNEVFDTANCFDSTTNYRFTPNVAGYYQLSGNCSMAAGSASQLAVIFFSKNGSPYAIGTSSPAYTTITNYFGISNLMYLNGSTDYVEMFVYHNYGSTWNTAPAQVAVWMTGSLVRAA
jgi:hypothetical protein